MTWVTYGQINEVTQQDTTQKSAIFEKLPEFPGGFQKIRQIISDSLIYPKTALEDGVGGKVVTRFAVDTLGNISDIKVTQGIREDIDKEAVRLIGLLNGWTPAIQGDKKVKVYFTLPLTFRPPEQIAKKYKKVRIKK